MNGSVGSLHFGACLEATASTAAGDSFTFSTMLGMQHLDWVQTLLVPWIIFFALAAVASAFSILSKLHFFVGKMRSNFARNSHLSASAVTVHDALYQNDFNTRKIYAYVNNAHAHACGSVCSRTHARFNRYMVVGLCEESVSAAPMCGRTGLQPASYCLQPLACQPKPRSLRPSTNHPRRVLSLQVVRRLPA